AWALPDRALDLALELDRLRELPSEVRGAPARGALQSAGKAGPGQPATHGDESIARAGFEAARRTAGHRDSAQDFRLSLRGLPGAFHRGARRAETAGHRL